MTDVRPATQPEAPARWGPRPLFADAVLALVTFVAIAIPMWTNHPNRGDRPVDAQAWLLPCVLAGVLFVRRRWPVPVLVGSAALLIGYYVLKYPPVGLELPLAAVFYTVAEAGRLWWGIGTGIVLQVVSFSARVSQGQDEQLLFAFELPPAVAILAWALALGDATRQRRLQRAERARAEAAAVLEHQLEAERRVEQERVHLARELHDVLAHTVSVIGIQAGVAAEAVEDGDGSAAARSIGAIQRTSRDAMRDLRATLGILRGESRAEGGHEPGSRAPAGSVAHLDLLAETTREAGLDVTVEVADDLAPLPSAIDTTAYRVVQEALTNVLRHSTATAAQVGVSMQDGHVEVVVTDPGPARQTPVAGAGDSSGHGLRGMTERVTLVGGHLEAGSLPGGGFRVRARLPL